jgi:nitrite reductase/ring-hydroxylating ferredoxin subunit
LEWVKIFASKTEARIRLRDAQPQLLVVYGRRICLVLRQGQPFAIDDTCPHNGESLSKGSLNYLGEIICPWHGYRFELKTGRESAERCKDVVTYPIREDDTGFYLGL